MSELTSVGLITTHRHLSTSNLLSVWKSVEYNIEKNAGDSVGKGLDFFFYHHSNLFATSLLSCPGLLLRLVALQRSHETLSKYQIFFQWWHFMILYFKPLYFVEPQCSTDGLSSVWSGQDYPKRDFNIFLIFLCFIRISSNQTVGAERWCSSSSSLCYPSPLGNVPKMVRHFTTHHSVP